MIHIDHLKKSYDSFTLECSLDIPKGMITGIVGEGSAKNVLPSSHVYYNVDIRTVDKGKFQTIVDDINEQFQIYYIIASV